MGPSSRRETPPEAKCPEKTGLNERRRRGSQTWYQREHPHRRTRPGRRPGRMNRALGQGVPLRVRRGRACRSAGRARHGPPSVGRREFVAGEGRGRHGRAFLYGRDARRPESQGGCPRIREGDLLQTAANPRESSQPQTLRSVTSTAGTETVSERSPTAGAARD